MEPSLRGLPTAAAVPPDTHAHDGERGWPGTAGQKVWLALW